MAESTHIDRHFKPADSATYLEGPMPQHPDWRTRHNPDGTISHVLPGEPGYEDAEPFGHRENPFRTIPEPPDQAA